jgi:hypothetical protein
VGGRVLVGLRPVVLNPLRSEQEAFRALLWVVAVVAAIVVLVLLARAVL